MVDGLDGLVGVGGSSSFSFVTSLAVFLRASAMTLDFAIALFIVSDGEL